MLTVIMPAAGKGTRLNLPYPKEILRLDKEQALIDLSFEQFRNYGRNDVRFVVIINEEKTDIVKYLSKYKDRYDIIFIYQDPHEQEYTGAIKSAKNLFTEYNLVMLPDSIMTLHPNTDLLQTTIKSLNEGCVFYYMPCQDFDMLKTKGAVVVDKGRIRGYEDKPTEQLEKFNGYWCSFGFTRYTCDNVLHFMEQTTLKTNKGNFDLSDLNGAMAIAVEDYRDLGTWDEIRRMLRDVI